MQNIFWDSSISVLQLSRLSVAQYVSYGSLGIIQGIHKRMVQFQKLTRNLFLTLHKHNVHLQQQ